MANLTAMANEMAKQFICAEDKKYALNKIIHDMNYLVYSQSKEPLDYKAKSLIFRHIFDTVAGRETLLLKEGETINPDFADIVLFFERRNFILKYLKAGVKKQSELN